MFVWKHNFWTRQKSLKWGKESLEDPKYISNVNSAILDSSKNQLWYKQSKWISNAKNEILVFFFKVDKIGFFWLQFSYQLAS